MGWIIQSIFFIISIFLGQIMKEINEEILQNFKKFIEKHNYFYVIGHKEPDGDCIASCLGVVEILKHYKKEYKLLSAGPFKRNEIKKYFAFFITKKNYICLIFKIIQHYQRANIQVFSLFTKI